MNEQNTDYSWVIGYGTNLNTDKIFNQLGVIPEYKKGFVKGYQRVFNVKTGLNGYGIANLSFKGNNQECTVVAWKLNQAQIKQIDSTQKVPSKYFRVSMPFQVQDGAYIPAQVYLANTDCLEENLYPEPLYLEVINKGLHEHGML